MDTPSEGPQFVTVTMNPSGRKLTGTYTVQGAGPDAVVSVTYQGTTVSRRVGEVPESAGVLAQADPAIAQGLVATQLLAQLADGFGDAPPVENDPGGHRPLIIGSMMNPRARPPERRPITLTFDDGREYRASYAVAEEPPDGNLVVTVTYNRAARAEPLGSIEGILPQARRVEVAAKLKAAEILIAMLRQAATSASF